MADGFRELIQSKDRQDCFVPRAGSGEASHNPGYYHRSPSSPRITNSIVVRAFTCNVWNKPGSSPSQVSALITKLLAIQVCGSVSQASILSQCRTEKHFEISKNFTGWKTVSYPALVTNNQLNIVNSEVFLNSYSQNLKKIRA